VILRLGIDIDIAVRAPHQASLADERGELLWSGHRFRTTAGELERLWDRLPAGSEPSEITIVMEPTRNAWVPLAERFRRHGAKVVLVSAERSADLRPSTPSTRRTIGRTRSCWPGCRCCTRRGCIPNGEHRTR
jgi:hypothetical protein